MCSTREKPVTAVMISNNVDEAVLLSDRIVPMTRAPKATLGAAVAVLGVDDLDVGGRRAGEGQDTQQSTGHVHGSSNSEFRRAGHSKKR